MKLSKLILATTLLSGLAFGTHAFAQGYDYNNQPYMPMVGGGPGGIPMMPGSQGQMPMVDSQGNTMSPMMMQQMMRMRQQGNNMPAMNTNSSANKPLPGDTGMMGGQSGGMPMMKMMQEKQAAMKQHMQTMETRLANIEVLLQQLVELQKSR